MGKTKKSYRSQEEEEQRILEGLTVRVLEEGEVERFDGLIAEHHYLRNARLVGEHMRYVAEYEGQWLALGAWSGAARHLKGRENWIGWDDEQRGRRLGLVANNARLLSVPGREVPNLLSRFMSGMLSRLSEDWQRRWGHPVAVVETFVDRQLYQGTCYKASGWSELSETAGFARSARGDYYQAHNAPKVLWVKELFRGARQKLRGRVLPESWQVVEASTTARCRARPDEIKSLMDLLEGVPEFRRPQGLRYPVAGMLALIAIATFSGVMHGQRDLAAFARTLSEAQMRALKFRRASGGRQRKAPGETTFMRVLAGVEARQVERALLLWQERVLGVAKEEIIAVDGKKLRHGQGVELVSAFGVESGRWLGSVCTEAKSNEIPAARELLNKVDVAGKTVVFDALHTQQETARSVVFEGGGDYVFTVKNNQQGLNKEIARLLAEQPFSPS